MNSMKIASLDIKDTGTIKEIRKGIVKIEGLPSCINGQLVELSSNLLGMIIGFDEEKVSALVLGDETRLNIGDAVYAEPGIFEIPVGNNFIGRTVNAFGAPTDGKGKIEASDSLPIFRDAPGVMDRTPIVEPLLTGIKTIDTVIPLGKGQRELIIGDRVTGKTTLALDAIINQRGKDVVCIYCWIGGSFSPFLKLIQQMHRDDILEYSIIVSALASDSPAEQYVAPYAAVTLGEHFMYQGRDVLVVFDNLTRHAWVYRQLSLLLERCPGREAYPGDIFYLHSQLMERSAKLNKENGSGSMTFLPIVETQEGDVTGIVPSNLISMTDGQIYLDTGLFHEGFKPAIDLGLSVSRIGSKVQCEAIKEVSGKLKGEYARYKELAGLTRIRTKLSPEVELKIKKGETLSSLLAQDKSTPLALEEIIVTFYAFDKGIPEILEDEKREKFKDEIYGYLKKEYPYLMEKLASQKALTEEIKTGLDEAFGKFFLTAQNSDERVLTE
ncbi:MAG: F0F1 ATP synthase subunit alpha [Candidatus Orphnella occulta]|nr:F0F1 ATP synthase subunit alpha [Candidatus Orphnella occulta]